MATTTTKYDKVTTESAQIQNGDFSAIKPKPKSLAIAYALWFPFGFLGLHRMYVGHWFMGIIYFFTLGYCGIGWITDGFLIPSIVRERNIQAEYNAAHPEELKRPVDCHLCGLPGRLRYRSLRDAYILTLSPFGLLGIQHQYLGKLSYRLAYSLTLGLFGVGWLTDIYRMPALVKKTNEEIGHLRRGMSLGELKRSDISNCTTLQAYLFAIPGFFGFHHFYLGRWKFGFVYIFTAGLFGIGWLVDLIRMPHLVERSNQERKTDKRDTKHLDDAYLMAFPLGILGAHYFYLNRPASGILYFFTLGLFGLGWLVDLFRMPSLVREANLRNQQTAVIIPANAQYPVYVPTGTNAYLFTPSAPATHPQNYAYPNLPSQNTQYPTAAPYPQYSQNPTAYQSVEYPPAYTQAVSDEDQSELKQYPPP